MKKLKKKVTAITNKGNKKIKLGQVASPMFAKALKDLSNDKLPILVAYNLAEIIEMATLKTDTFNNLRMNLIKKHSILDDKGEPTLSEDRTSYLIKDSVAFEKDFNDLCDIELEMPEIKLKDLEGIHLSPLALTALKPLITP